MPDIDSLLEMEPFSMGAEDKDKAFIGAMRESLIFHYDNCAEFRRFCEKRGFDPKGKYSANDIPFLPVGVFKTVKLLSVDEKNISKNVNSSSTTSGMPSRVYIDDLTSKRQRKALNKIMSSFISGGRRNFIIFDSESTVKSREGRLSSRATAIRGFLPFMKEAFYVLDDNLRIDPNALKKAADASSGEKVHFLGFTYVLYEAIMNADNETKRIASGISGGSVLHLGGWKRLRDLNIQKQDFNSMVSKFLNVKRENVVDIYGMTEQLGTIYPDCEYGYKHVPLYSDIIIRDISTLKPAGKNQQGFIQLLSPIPHSYPGVSIISDDIGKVVLEDGCKCGRRGKAFVFVGRAKRAEIKGCGDTLRDGV